MCIYANIILKNILVTQYWLKFYVVLCLPIYLIYFKIHKFFNIVIFANSISIQDVNHPHHDVKFVAVLRQLYNHSAAKPEAENKGPDSLLFARIQVRYLRNQH